MTRLGLCSVSPVLSVPCHSRGRSLDSESQPWCSLSCHLLISRLYCEAVLGLGNSCLIGPFHAVLLALGLRVKGVIRGLAMIGRQRVEWAGVFGHGAGSNIFILLGSPGNGVKNGGTEQAACYRDG